MGKTPSVLDPDPDPNPDSDSDLESPVPDLAQAPASAGVSGDRARGARTTMQALARSPDVFEAFFDSAQIGLALADLAGNYVRVNATYSALLGRAPEDLVGKPIVPVLRAAAADAPGLARLATGRAPAVQAEDSHRLADGRVTWVLHGIASVAGADGEPGWFAVSAQDITERRHAEMELRALTDVLAERAVRDPLTGLANRELLAERLRAALARDIRSGGSTAVLFLDLDGFKQVNDRHGHAVGDEVLRRVAARLSGVVRPSDTVARLGGDEFVVLVEACTPDSVGALLRRLEVALAEPVAVEDLSLLVSASVGVATVTGGQADAAGLLSLADARMYDVKRAR